MGEKGEMIKRLLEKVKIQDEMIKSRDEIISDLRDDLYNLRQAYDAVRAEKLTLTTLLKQAQQEAGRLQTEVSSNTYSNVQALQGFLAERDKEIIRLQTLLTQKSGTDQT